MKGFKKLIILSSSVMLLGCSNKTETGYEPRKLSDSETVQRGYYASPFSPERQAAQAEKAVEFSNRRPTDWRGSY